MKISNHIHYLFLVLLTSVYAAPRGRNFELSLMQQLDTQTHGVDRDDNLPPMQTPYRIHLPLRRIDCRQGLHRTHRQRSCSKVSATFRMGYAQSPGEGRVGDKQLCGTSGGYHAQREAEGWTLWRACFGLESKTSGGALYRF
ncbi:hypothetical protein EV361DRAFT_312680 [Lentinula raphanica]|nr:hypothetical protein EV361DRAFT_312680 [Lentinula raphanica]